MSVTMPATLRVGMRVIKRHDSSSGAAPGPGSVLGEPPMSGPELELREDRHAASSIASLVATELRMMPPEACLLLRVKHRFQLQLGATIWQTTKAVEYPWSNCLGRLDARGHGHIADIVGAVNAERQRLCRSAAIWCGWVRSTVKPSAQPTLVRTQHLPPPAKTARSLRKRGPRTVFSLSRRVSACINYGSMRSSGYGHITDRVRAERAVRITARFADLCPFCPIIGRRDCSSDDCRTSRSAGSVPRRPPRAGRRAGFVRACGRAGCRIGTIPIASRLPLRRWPGTRRCRRMEDRHSPLRERLCRGVRVPNVPGQGLDPAKPVDVSAVDW
jgi:hypothetical protein